LSRRLKEGVNKGGVRRVSIPGKRERGIDGESEKACRNDLLKNFSIRGGS